MTILSEITDPKSKLKEMYDFVKTLENHEEVDEDDVATLESLLSEIEDSISSLQAEDEDEEEEEKEED